MSRDEAQAATGGYMETLRERLSDSARGSLATHLPDELAARLKGEGEGEEFSVWEFYERLSQKAGLSLEHSTRHARHVGNVLSVAVPEEDLVTAREELDPEYWELSERILPDPQYYGSYEQRPDSLKPSDAPVRNGAGRA